MPKIISFLTIATLVGLGGILYFLQLAKPVKTNLDIIERVKQNDIATLESHFTSLLKDYHNDPNTELALSIKYEAFANSDPVFEPLLSAWLEAYPDSIAAKLALGRHYSHLGWLSRGTRYISKTHDNQINAMNEYFGRASNYFLQVIKQDPDMILAYHGILSMVKTMRNPVLEETVTAKAMAVRPDSYLFNYQRLFAMQPKWGGSLEAIDDAIKKLEPYFEKNPKLELLKGFQAIAMADEIIRPKRDDETCASALQYIEEALKKYQTPQLYSKRGSYHRCLSEYEEAIADYSRAISLASYDADYYIKRARNYLSLKNYDKAIEDLHVAISYDTLNPRALKYLGRAYYRKKDYEKAKVYFEDSLTFGQYSYYSHRMLGYIYYNTVKDFVSAEREFGKAKEYGDRNPRTLVMIASAQHQQKDCKFVSTAEAYLKQCESSKKTCSEKYLTWANNAIQHVRQEGTCP